MLGKSGAGKDDMLERGEGGSDARFLPRVLRVRNEGDAPELKRIELTGPIVPMRSPRPGCRRGREVGSPRDLTDRGGRLRLLYPICKPSPGAP